MSAPTVNITRSDNPPPRSTDTDTGKLFLAGLFDRGPIDVAVECINLNQVKTTFGDRQTYSTAIDEAETFFGEGGHRLIVGRYVGPAAANASRNLLDASSAVSLVATAKYPGAYANTWTIQVTHPNTGTFQIVTAGVDGNGDSFTETSPEFTATSDATAWSDAGGSDYITLTQGASTNDPDTLAASVLGSTTSGTDDRSSATDTQRQTALDLFNEDFGPGQVKIAGATASATHAIVQAHAETFGRVAILDCVDTATVSTITTVAAADRPLTGAHSAELVGNWVTIPPLTSGGAPRSVPGGAAHAGVIARNDGSGLSPNQAAAGDYGQLRYATGLTQPAWTSAQRDTLADAGVTVIRTVGGALSVYDDVTLADPDDDPNWTFFSNARFFMYIRANALRILQGYMFRQIDGKGYLFGEIKGDLVGLLLPFWPNKGLYGDTSADAFNIDFSDNTDETIQNGELHVSLALRMSPPAKDIEMAIIKVALTGSVA